MEERRQGLIWVITTALLQNKHLLFRMLITISVLLLLFYIVRILAFANVKTDYKDVLFAIIGAVIANYGKVIDFWFHKDDEAAPIKRDKKDAQ